MGQEIQLLHEDDGWHHAFMRREQWGGLAMAAMLLFASRTWAQDEVLEDSESANAQEQDAEEEREHPEVATARRHYQQGVVFFRADRHEEAIAEFTEAYSLWPNPLILYSLAQAHERLLRVPRAISYYQRYLQSDEVPVDRRAEVEAKIVGLQSILATVVVSSNVELAVLFIDGEEVGPVPASYQVATGQHTFEVRADGHEPSRQELRVAAQTEREIAFELAPIEVRVEQTTTRVVVERERGVSPIYGWVGLGLTLAAGAAATGFGVRTLNAAQEYDDDPFRTESDRNDGERLALTTDIMLGATALLAIGTVLLLILADWGDEEEPPATQAGLAPVVRGAVGFVGRSF